MKMKISFTLFAALLLLMSFKYSPKHESLTKLTCPAPLDIALFKNGGGRPIAPGSSLDPSTNYLIKLSTQTPGYACITNSSGITYSGNGCEDVTPDGGYHPFKTITTNSSLPYGISVTITSFCYDNGNYVQGGSATFTYP